MEATKLDLISTKDLVDELCKRHDGLVISGIKFTTMTNFVLTKHWAGNHFVCLGLLADMEHLINKKGDTCFIPNQNG